MVSLAADTGNNTESDWSTEMTSDLKYGYHHTELNPLAMRIRPLKCRLAFRASTKEKAMLLDAAKKHGLGLGEYVLALHRHYLNQVKA